ncbi:MAG: response regulator [Actinomycetia bacterium]|nr:response regulator [Actinomycetes bacterium]
MTEQSLGRVMVVDDSPTIRELIALNLGLEGYDVQTAEDGEECLRLLAEVTEGRAPAPQLLCLDVVMPGLDGVELTAKLKATPSMAQIPILIVSASAQRRDFELAQGAGADGYLTKPFDPEELLAEVGRLITKA